MHDQASRLRLLAAAESRPPVPPDRTGGQRRGGQGRVIAVCSGKGGVGKSNISLLLAISLSSLGKKVLIVDADLGLANVHLLIGTAPKRNLSHVARGECSVEEIICEGPGGVFLVPGASGVEWMANLEPVKLELLERQLAGLESAFDLLIIDTPAGIGPVTVGFASQADTCLVVMTPEPTSLADAYAMIKVLQEHETPRIDVLVNMCTTDAEGREAFDRLSSLVVKFLRRPVQILGALPHDAELSRNIKAQRIILFEKPNRPLSLRINAVARILCGRGMVTRGGFFSRIFFRSRAGRGA